MSKKFLALQLLFTGGGMIFSWSVLAQKFVAFQGMYGTIFRVRDCIIPNPVTTPCFYGAIAFLVSFIWAGMMLTKFNEKQQRWLRNFLIFGVVFAWSVLAYELLQFYRVFGGPVISCNPGAYPLNGPCAVGSVFFVAAAITAIYIVRRGAVKPVTPPV